MKRPLRLAPYFSPRPWGGRKLQTLLGKALPEGEAIGEAWELSDHPDGRSRVAEGPHAGAEFGELVQSHPSAICGTNKPPARYPLLIKYIDAREDLSIQVHPDDAKAAPHGDRGKTECWYIMDCPEGTELILGLREGTGPKDMKNAVERRSVGDLMRRPKIYPGAFVYVPAGTVHAILGGTLLCEIQQSSNITYRLWDWDRRPPRELHVDEAVAATRFAPEPDPRLGAPFIRDTRGLTGLTELIRNPYFVVRLLGLNANETFDAEALENRRGLILNVVEGSGMLAMADGDRSFPLRLGDTSFLPVGLGRFAIQAAGEGLRLLVSESLELGN